MKILFPLIILSLIVAGCSSYQVTDQKDTKKNIFKEELKERALEHFINGSVAESNGDYANAILEFQDALRLNPSAGIYYALGKNYFFLNKLSLALQNTREAVKLDSNQIEYLNLLADIYSTAHQNDSAAVIVSKIIAIDSSNVQAYYKLGRMYENNRPLQAIRIYEKLTSMIGPEWNVLVRTAELWEKLGDRKKAAETIEEMLHIDPSNVPLQKLLAEYYEKADENEKALSLLDDIILLMPEDMDARERRAKLMIKKGEWDLAAKEYAILMKQPGVPLDVKIRIGAVYFAESLRDSTILPAAKDIFTILDADTTDWQIKMYLGAIAINENDDSTAISYFKTVTELASWNVEAWIRLGGIYFDNGKYEEAKIVMKEAVGNFPEDFVVNLILGLSYAQTNNHQAAKDYLSKAVELNPNDLTALSAYGFTLNQVKESDSAVHYLTMALKLDPDNVNLLGTLGMIYDSREEWAKCDSVYERALEIDADDPLVNNNFAYSLSERDIQLERALSMVEISLTADPTNSSYLDTKGWILFKMGNFKGALDYIQKSIDAGSNSAEVFEHMGDVTFMLGDADKAKTFWEKALELDKDNVKLKNKVETGTI
jgi:tetratricopeptide (TPR) repeat protein